MTLSMFATHKVAMLSILCILLLILTCSLIKRDRSATSRIDLDSLLVDDTTGKVSKSACVMMGAFAFTTWLMGYLTLDAKMTEGYFAMYLAGWVTPFVTKLVRETSTQTVQKLTVNTTNVDVPPVT